jgi:hypothetical protein
MKNLIKVSLLREQLSSNCTSGIESMCGVYCWWFKTEVVQTLLVDLQLTPEEIAKIQKREIEGESYLALYFGISKDMLARAKWHILQKHSPSAVKHGTLSTLRQTLSALLGKDMSQSEHTVNEFIDCNCYWEWEYDESYKQRETDELSSTTKCYPLNIQENQTVNKEVCKKLSELRKQHKK